MAQATNIEWCDLSWNPTHGCSRVSTGCKHCYAETLSLRYGQTSKPWTARNAPENVLLKPHKLREPLSNAKAWRGLGTAAAAAGKTDGKLVFVNSMSDLFHEQIPDEYIAQVFNVMAEACRHTFQVLTKRPGRMRDFVAAWVQARGLVLPNVWLGVSIENRKWVGRADVLRETPAAVRFISAEPLLGPLVNVSRADVLADAAPCEYPAIAGDCPAFVRCSTCPEDHADLDLTGIDWLILGGESGSGHRPCDVQWMRDLHDACMAQRGGNWPASKSGSPCPDAPTTTALFVKQLGGHRPGTALEDLPEDLRIREFPR